MEFTRIANRQAREWLRTALDDDVLAVQQEEDMANERVEIDALIEAVDREMAAEARAETERVQREVRGQVRARRARRRADREVLRSLPVRLDRTQVGDWIESEAA
ncbi:hypothetical protein H0B56_17285 [Haloechinothrix sp. YIM 98757]|uniref:Uncharacterized protein n=1 Tax=Haloechinothrix aidingensis TaxID=2752311 RepID=A0A838ADS0_9PSEU|nr:hypothetical protein [Haloechinothrix aidingensis]MBA0127305.1 hypothetical protein [Haloechinothrix aidingensis]